MTLPLAHIGHNLWVFYILPVVFVVIGIVRTTLSEKRRGQEEDSDDD
jgi:cytochrome c-type biogenesis protein CcmH/NrfF